MGELLPADAFDHMDVGGRAMSGTIAKIELVLGDGLNDLFKRTLVAIRLLADAWVIGFLQLFNQSLQDGVTRCITNIANICATFPAYCQETLAMVVFSYGNRWFIDARNIIANRYGWRFDYWPKFLRSSPSRYSNVNCVVDQFQTL